MARHCPARRRLGVANTHLLGACGHRDGLVLGQVAVVDHAGELSGVSHMLEALLLEHQLSMANRRLVVPLVAVVVAAGGQVVGVLDRI
jgi:hypothetical protein